MHRTYSATLIQAMINSLPAALLLVDYNRQATDAFVSNRRIRHFHPCDFGNLLLRFLPAEAVRQIIEKFEQALTANEAVCVRRITYQTSHGCEEFVSCSIVPIPSNRQIAVLFLNQSESVLLEQEFEGLTQQAASAQQELLATISELDFRLMDLTQSHKRLQALYQVTAIVQRDITQHKALEEILDIIMTEFTCLNGAVLLLNEAGDTLEMRVQRGYSQCQNIPINLGITGYCARKRELVFVPDVSQDPRYIPGTAECVSELAIPLIVNNRLLGVLDIGCASGGLLSSYDIDLLQAIAAQAGITIAHVQRIEQIKKTAITDDLTGLYNFHHFSTLLEHEYQRANHYGTCLSLLMIDIDNFKEINDSYGHIVGNEVLAQMAKLISKHSRVVDWVCRYGGDEFAVVLPETNLDEATTIAERIRRTVTEHTFAGIAGQEHLFLTVSIGVSSMSADNINKRELIAHADLALFAAKRISKNCVRVYRHEGGET